MGLYLGKQRITPVINKGRKFGATIDDWLGKADANGAYQMPYEQFVLDLTGVKSIGASKLMGQFFRRTNLREVKMGTLEAVDSYGLYMCFRAASNLIRADLSKLISIGQEGLYQAFYACAALQEVDFSSLRTLGINALAATFYNCQALTKIYFPALTSVHSTGFGSGSWAFQNCPNMAEIHFRADVKEQVEAAQGYSNKFGATNATIYFDL